MHVFRAPSSPPWREELNNVINHLPERGSLYMPALLLWRPRLGGAHCEGGTDCKEAEKSDRHIHTATLKSLTSARHAWVWRPQRGPDYALFGLFGTDGEVKINGGSKLPTKPQWGCSSVAQW